MPKQSGQIIKCAPAQKRLPAIMMSGVRKEYRLYQTLFDQALDVLGLAWLRFWRKVSYSSFVVLNGIDLQVDHGERIGIIGRNGAGKTTLFKLIIGNVIPTTGQIEIDGTVQALMHVGLGFHNEFTGSENVRASLLYNGLVGDELEKAFEDVVAFAELDEFINQPLKSYSTGMRARLQFAAATAVKPDILIVDEVLGAGDAYFSTKSAARMEAMASSGCTFLLVSHSSSQVLQFCSRAVWLEQGEVVMDAEAESVMQAYDQFTKKLEEKAEQNEAGTSKSILHNDALRLAILDEVLATAGADSVK